MPGRTISICISGKANKAAELEQVLIPGFIPSFFIKSKDLLGLTGYVHGGCSPIGMKKAFPTTIDASAKTLEKIYFSAGKIGYQVEVATDDISKIIDVTFKDITECF